MTGDSDLYSTSGGPRTLPLFEGKMIHQFTSDFAQPRYWVKIAEGRKRVLGAASITVRSWSPILFACASGTWQAIPTNEP